ncbi:MAG: TIR domain-containing protein [Clostridia bacterium]|nr:TIR domain-containing protein [Clostridia bacterium]
MAILKCKMCGGDILLSEDKTTGTCDHCGSTMTFPRVSDEQKLNLYNRANHFRRQNEFDKAITAYERILDQDDTDAEAHWGTVLSRYGIEYVEDPVTHERIPTCHRVQLTSILSDGDYLAALENAPDTASRDLYEQEARRIAEIQKGILYISSQEKPYDVFICYKETDDSGSRTKDSTLAQEIYYQLTNEGYKVFFSRITLEDKLGQQYEPYIFAALNSAKVMLVVGTKPECFNAVWVKNEWSRYLALMKIDRSRLLIPCYRDMDPYDLPEELSALQSQDMSKIGFMQDLIRGVKKVLDSKKPEAAKPQTVVQQAAPAAASVENLVKRAYLFMEDGDFKSANEYLDRVLDEDAEYAPAYAAKVCTALGFRKESDLAEATFLYADHPDWKKALRFANPKQKDIYEGYYTQVKQRVHRQIQTYAYDCAIEMAVDPHADRKQLDLELEQYTASCETWKENRADGSRRAKAEQNEASFLRAVQYLEPGDVTESGFKTAAEMFQDIGDNASETRARECLILAEQALQKGIYQQAEKQSERAVGAYQLDRIAELFLTIPDYKDAKERAKDCHQRAESKRESLYNDTIEIIQKAGDESTKWKKVQDWLNLPDLDDYRDVPTLRVKAAQRYKECVEAEKEERHRKQQQQAAALERAKPKIIFACLAALLIVAAVIVTIRVIIPGHNYRNAIALRQEGRYEEAITLLSTLGDYSDSAAQITETRYQQAKALNAKGDYTGAFALLRNIRDYKDVASLLVNDHNLSVAAKEAINLGYSVGDYVTFGHYPQTREGNDSTPIEWLVLDRGLHKALLISRYALDAKPYNIDDKNTTWEKSTLRAWLNDTFMNKAFTEQEQTGILLTNVDNSISQGYWTTSNENHTQDRIFLLSYTEASKYMDFSHSGDGINSKSQVVPTAYALLEGASSSNDSKTANGAAVGRWWLRSPGRNQSIAMYVDYDGSFSSRSVSNSSVCVRPALWIDIDLVADIF